MSEHFTILSYNNIFLSLSNGLLGVFAILIYVYIITFRIYFVFYFECLYANENFIPMAAINIKNTTFICFIMGTGCFVQ